MKNHVCLSYIRYSIDYNALTNGIAQDFNELR
jgi:hypothetical protein